jgi:hypothetical protein
MIKVWTFLLLVLVIPLQEVRAEEDGTLAYICGCYQTGREPEMGLVLGLGYGGLLANYVKVENGSYYDGWELMYHLRLQNFYGFRNGIYLAYGQGNYRLESYDMEDGPDNVKAERAKIGVTFAFLNLGAVLIRKDLDENLLYDDGKKTFWKEEVAFFVGIGGVIENAWSRARRR